MTTLQLKNYRIHIGDIGAELNQLTAAGNYSKVAVLLDENTRRHCLPVLANAVDLPFKTIEISAGEKHKSLDTCAHIWGEMMQLGLDRHSLLLNLGGGVIGDMGGFCAATYLRGIDFVQVPTTLLSQVDASVGGKLGIDFNFVKNAVGVFHDPRAVFINPAFLKTLPEAELRSGFAEIFKHALIADAGLWQDLQAVADFQKIDWEPLLARSLRIKQQVVEADPFEQGLRKALNFGHTIGHAVESLALQQGRPLLHGEAVAIGCVCEAFLSKKISGLTDGEVAAVAGFVRQRYPHFSFLENDFPELLRLMGKDKKNRAGQIRFALLPVIGQVIVDQVCDEQAIAESLRYYLAQG